MDDKELKKEEESLEYEEYESEDPDDTFEIWKVKKYVDVQITEQKDDIKEYINSRINQIIIGLIGGVIVYFLFLRNF